MYIKAPQFRTPECDVRCCKCENGCVLYWVKDEVWKLIEDAASCCGGHVCPTCAEEHLGRCLTLHDLAVVKYKLTAKNERGGKPRVVHCLVDTVLGAAAIAGVPIPPIWCWMWDDYYNLGMKLAQQTADPEEVVPTLIAQTLAAFPNFRNPYELA